MKLGLVDRELPADAVFITCASHEERCLGALRATKDWSPTRALVFHYDDVNPRREEHHTLLVSGLTERGCDTRTLQFIEASAVTSLRDNMAHLRTAITTPQRPLVLDISVFTKRHLLMILRWLDDLDRWDDLFVIYSEPLEYDVSPYVPLSFGLSSFNHIPGFAATADLSRPVHLALFLGYEGDRARAVYEHVEPMHATLYVTEPPFNDDWRGRTEKLNADLLAINGFESVRYVDGLDPESTERALAQLFAEQGNLFARLICPLGTKPQTLGVYSYLRRALDSAAIVHASPLRHNHDFYSHGVGASWLLKRGDL